MRSIDERMLSFVAWHGAVPPDAEKINDDQARQHIATWVRRYIGGRSVSYVIGFARGSRWWTFFFDKLDRPLAPDGAEVWSIEGYGSVGESWPGQYYFWPESNRWRHVFYALAGEDYGREPSSRRDGEGI